MPTAAESTALVWNHVLNLVLKTAVIIAGARTPSKSFGELMQVDTIGLGVAAVSGRQKTKLDPTQIIRSLGCCRVAQRDLT